MTTFKNKNINNLCRISSFLLLVLICGNQVYQFSHLHHFHEDDSLVVEVSYHPVDVDVLHSSDHVHGEEKSSHSSGHQHKYENKVDWNITRSQATNDSTFDILDLAFSAFYLPSVVCHEKYTSFYRQPSFTKEHSVSSSVIRGPPLFG